MGRHMKRGSGVTAGYITFCGYAVVYSEQDVDAQFFMDHMGGPQVFMTKPAADAKKRKMQQEFPGGIWRVIRVELKELAGVRGDSRADHAVAD